MRKLLCLTLFLTHLQGKAQNLNLDKKHYEEKLKHMTTSLTVTNKTTKNEDVNFLVRFYQKRLSVLISAECLYQPSCSNYCADYIKLHGFLPAIFAAGDRLTRCNVISAMDSPEWKYNGINKIDDTVK